MNRSHLPQPRFALTAAALLVLTGSALGQNALGGGRALDGGLSNQPGGRVNASISDLQSIVRINTNAGNALNGPGYIPGNGRSGIYSGSFTRSFSSPYGGSLSSTTTTGEFDRIATLEAGYLPGGSLTSSVLLPQGTVARDYHRSSDPYVGVVRDQQGGVVMTRGSSLRGVTLDPIERAALPSDPDVPKVGTAATYSRVIDELRRSSLARSQESSNRIDTSVKATPSPTAPAPTTADTGKTPTPPGTGTYDTDAALKRLRERLAANKAKPAATPVPDRNRPQPNGVTTPDPSNNAATPMLTEEDINVLRGMGLKLDTLVPPGSTDAQATDGYTRLGQEALAAGRFGLADQLFESAVGRSPSNTLAQAGRIHATMGLGLLMSAGADLRTYFVEHPEMIPVRFDSSLLMPPGRADRLAEMISADIARTDGSMLNNGGLTLAYLGRQFDNASWLQKGFEAMAKQTKDDPQGTELLSILQKVWGAPAPSSVTPAPAPASTPTK